MDTSPPIAALLLLGDGRLPTGGHVHSGGVEAAVASGAIRDVDDLHDFLAGRLHTVGLQDAALAAAVHTRVAGADPGDRRAHVRSLDLEADARLPVAPLRDASRRQGRQLARVAARCWPDPVFADLRDVCPAGPHQAVALGAVGVAAGLGERDVAWLAVHHVVTTGAQAGLRLLGLDPFAVAATTAQLAAPMRLVVDAAVTASRGPVADLPARSGPVADIAALDHQTWDTRLFAT